MEGAEEFGADVFLAEADPSIQRLDGPSDSSSLASLHHGSAAEDAEGEEVSDEDDFEIVLDTEAADKGIIPAPAVQHRPHQYIRPGVAPSPPTARPPVRTPPSSAVPVAAVTASIVSAVDSPLVSKPKQNVMDLDLDNLNEKPWRRADADMSDYFNYGFNEETWKAYCQKQAQIRLDQAVASKASKPAAAPSQKPRPLPPGASSQSEAADISIKPLPVVIPPPGRHIAQSANSATAALPPASFPPPVLPSFKPPILIPGAPPFGIPPGLGMPGMFPPGFAPPGMVGLMMPPPFDRPPRAPPAQPSSHLPDGSGPFMPGNGPLEKEHRPEDPVHSIGRYAVRSLDRDRDARDRYSRDREWFERERLERDRRDDRDRRDQPVSPPRTPPEHPRTPPDISGPEHLRRREERDRRERRERPWSPPRYRDGLVKRDEQEGHKPGKEDDDRLKRRRTDEA